MHATRIAGALIAITGFVFLVIARVQLGSSFAIMPRAKELVTHGLYSRIRNPMYVFIDVMLFGLILLFGVPWLFLSLVVLILAQMKQAHREAAVLLRKFGPAYLEYRKHTWF